METTKPAFGLYGKVPEVCGYLGSILVAEIGAKLFVDVPKSFLLAKLLY